jgi:hypothetical protein
MPAPTGLTTQGLVAFPASSRLTGNIPIIFYTSCLNIIFISLYIQVVMLFFAIFLNIFTNLFLYFANISDMMIIKGSIHLFELKYVTFDTIFSDTSTHFLIYSSFC